MGNVKEVVRLIVKETLRSLKEMNEATMTGNVAGYNTPFAFSKSKAQHKKNAKRLTKSSSYYEPALAEEQLNENRWLELKKDDTRNNNRKLADGTSYIRNQLREMSKYLKWYDRIKAENNLTPDRYHIRTQKNIQKISELVKHISNQLEELNKNEQK